MISTASVANGIEITFNPAKTETIKVLHVDDDPTVLVISKEILMTGWNFEIDTALNVEEAFKKLSNKEYDAIISDYEMPIKDGLQFLKELRQQNSHIPFVLFTGKGREEVAVKALNLGAEGYYNKQGDLETVYTELAYGIKLCYEKNKVKKALEESEEKFKLLADESPNIIFINKKGKLVYTNKKASSILGYSSKEFLLPNFNFLSIIAAESWLTLKDAFSKHVRGEEVAPYECKLVSRTGRLLDVQINTKLIDYEGNKAILAVVTDITDIKKAEAESKKAQEAVRKSNQTIDSIINSTTDLIYALDMNWNFLYANKQMAKIAGLEEPAQLVGKKGQEIFPKALGTTLEETIGKVMNEKQAQRIIYTDSKMAVWENNIFPIENGVTVFAKDITECQQVENQLRESQAQMDIYLENCGVPALIANPEGKYVYVNKSATELLGYTSEELLQMHIPQLVFKDDPQERFAKLKSKGSIRGELRLRRKDGKPVLVDLKAVKLPNQLLIAFCEDITERKKLQDELFASQEKLNLLFENVFDLLVLVDTKGKILDVNKRVEEFFGYTKEEVVGKYFTKLGALSLKQMPKFVKLFFDSVRAGKLEGIVELELKHKNGTIVPVEISSGFIKDKNGKTLGVVNIIRVITERKNAEEELKKTNRQLHLATEKLQTMGSLTRHDVRNRMMNVNGYVYLLKRKLSDQPELIGYIEGIEAQINQSAKLLNFNATYEKIGLEKTSDVDVGESFVEAIKLLPEASEIKTTNECEGLTVVADSMLSQLLYNLIDNSLKHGEKVSEIKLSYLQDDGVTKLFYEDNGVGIRMNNKNRIFEGYTTGGSGLGLRLVKKMIEAYGWSIVENGVPDRGARFEITIPNQSQV